MSEKQPFDPIVPVQYYAESGDPALVNEGEKAFKLAGPIDAPVKKESDKPYELPHKQEDLTALSGLKRVFSSVLHAPDAMDRMKADRKERKEGRRQFKRRLKADLKEGRNMRNAVDNANTAAVYGNGGRGEVVEDFDPNVIPIGRRRRQYVRNERRMAKRLNKAGKIRSKLDSPSKQSSEVPEAEELFIHHEQSHEATSQATEGYQTQQQEHLDQADSAERQEKIVAFIKDSDAKTKHILGVLLSGRRLHENTIRDLLSDRKHDATHTEALETIEYLKDHGVIKDFAIDKYYQAAITEDEYEVAAKEAEEQNSDNRADDSDQRAAMQKPETPITHSRAFKAQNTPSEATLYEVAEDSASQPEEEVYDIDFVEDTPEASEPQKDTEPKAQESDSDNTEFKSNTGIDVAILRSLSKEISHSVSDTVRATKQERNLGKDDKLPREDFESILNNAVEVNIKDWLVKTGLASKEETAKLQSMFEHIKTDLDNFRKYSDRKQASKEASKTKEKDATQAADKKSPADQYEELLKTVPNA